MNKEILFTVTIPAYKRKFFKEAIVSVLAQTYPKWELVIVDDASPEDLKGIVSEFNDSRIRYYRNDKNIGAENVVDNWNKCLGYAKGDYIICMGDDDRLLPNCLEEYALLIEKYHGIGLLHGWTELIDEDSQVTRLAAHRCEFESAMSLAWHRCNAYREQYIGDFCFDTDELRKHGGFYKLPMAWGSDDISAIIAAQKNGVANTQRVVFQYRVNSLTISRRGSDSVKMEAVLLDYQWRKKFYSVVCDNDIDETYRKDLLITLEHEFDKRKSMRITSDMKNMSFARFFYWVINKKKYNINFRTLAHAFIGYFK